MGDELSSFEKRYVNDTIQGFFSIGIVIWLFAAMKIYYYDRLPDSLWDHSGKENMDHLTGWIVALHPNIVSIALWAIGFILAGVLFSIMTCCVMAFYESSIEGVWDRMFPNKHKMTERQSFYARWFVILPITLPIWFVIPAGLYQLARFELWAFYR